ncbi:probable indole-3-acetic acid-amido synthetase GH3.6 isoform X1 [Vigna unguiculata]|uniref:Auxin responsive GH3 protein family n=1 Tax=Vigna unguiculata TaxID=3917 RepID=A0A4D6MAZ5_VIGUN|nr:probable indole-3-acetic acid-amido synthetase GH3.6 isoform X1 [Vigna unguiculata]QCD97581.1 auxin responsive GH3 protein family [Vigna unguiculata]
MMTDEELMQKLEDLTINAQHHQLETLRSILLHNATVRYLQPFFNNSPLPLDHSTFTRLVPLSSHGDYVDYINLMADGKDDPFLSVDPLRCFFYSSGTSSSTMRPKLIPYFDSSLCKAASFIGHRGSIAVLQRVFPPRPEVNKILFFLYADNTTTTKCGLKVMPASTYPLQSGNATPQQLATFSSPLEVILGSHVEHQMYCHLLCGLRNLDVIDGIATPYAIGLIKAFGLLESKWGQLCDDLDHGFPCNEISEGAMREAVTKTLGGPQPDLADRIRLICEGNNWGGIVCRLWPNSRYIRCVTTGSMKQYYQKLKYYAGEVPILGGDYLASECCIGLNLDMMQPPETTRFVILPTFAYFEFLPFDMNEDNVSKETVELCSVEVGKMYEVVVTTYRGLYRYRLGDIVRVVGFHNSSPEVDYVMRAPKNPAEIVTEKDLISAVEDFQLALRDAMKIEIVEYASFLDQGSLQKQLKVFVEVQDESNFLEDKLEESVKVFRSCMSTLESGLGAIYKVQRDKGQLRNLLLFIVRPGAFDQLSDIAIQNGTSASQYKPPKIIRNHEVVKLLENLAIVIVSFDG